MKKIITSALVVLATATGFSQEVKFGVKGGLNFATLRGGDDIISTYANGEDDGPMRGSHKGKTGFHIGGFMEYGLNEKWSIQPELLISKQGAKFENVEIWESNYNGTEIETFNQKVNLTYINIPVLLKYNVIDKLNIEFGPQIGILVSANHKFDYSLKTSSNVESESYKLKGLKEETISTTDDGGWIDTRIYKKNSRVDLGLNFGASYDINDNLFVQARYTLGLTNNKVLNADEYSYDPYTKNTTYDGNIKRNEVKNSVFQLSIGYKF